MMVSRQVDPTSASRIAGEALVFTIPKILRDTKLISPGKLADQLSWKHSGFHIHDVGRILVLEYP